jgi:hypothetical protein
VLGSSYLARISAVLLRLVDVYWGTYFAGCIFQTLSFLCMIKNKAKEGYKSPLLSFQRVHGMRKLLFLLSGADIYFAALQGAAMRFG